MWKANVRKHRRGNNKMDNPETLAIWSTKEQDEDKQSKKTHHNIETRTPPKTRDEG
jgi:hypothetical protein